MAGTTLKENMLMLSAAPKLMEAARAAWNCISELPPTLARVEVVQMLQAALEAVEGDPDSKASRKASGQGLWVMVPMVAPDSMAALLTPYSIEGLETEQDKAAIRARMHERWGRLLTGAGALPLRVAVAAPAAVAMLRSYAEGNHMHLFRGLCPDHVQGHASRDPDCHVCRALDETAPGPLQDDGEGEALRCAEWMEHIAAGGEVVEIDGLARACAAELRRLHAIASASVRKGQHP